MRSKSEEDVSSNYNGIGSTLCVLTKARVVVGEHARKQDRFVDLDHYPPSIYRGSSLDARGTASSTSRGICG